MVEAEDEIKGQRIPEALKKLANQRMKDARLVTRVVRQDLRHGAAFMMRLISSVFV